MPAIKRESLWTLEGYARERVAFRAKVIAHKARRKVFIGEHVTLQFEDELTIRYQIQEMLRVERIFEEQGIQDELEAYNPLVPDGHNFKATMLIEYPDVTERAPALARLRGVEDHVYLHVPSASMRLPMRIWNARTRKRPRRCTSCALNCQRLRRTR